MKSVASSADFFEAKYRAADDPWEFATSAYELDRYSAIMRVIGGRRYRRAYEPGCSVGVLTERLAGICDQVLATDFSATAVVQARARCAALQNVRVECAALRDGTEAEGCDLVVLSEIGYYFEAAVWAEVVGEIVRGMAAGGVLVACHWLGSSADHILGGEQVHEAFRKHHKLLPLQTHREAEEDGGYLLEGWGVGS